MSSMDLKTAKATYGGASEAEMLQNMARAWRCRLIYKYANDYGDKRTHTDYKVIMAPGDSQEQALLNSPLVHNIVLVYRDAVVLDQPV